MHFVHFFFLVILEVFNIKLFYRVSIFFENSLKKILHSHYHRASVSSLGEPTNKTEKTLCSQLFGVIYISALIPLLFYMWVFFFCIKRKLNWYTWLVFFKIKISLVLVTIILVQTYDTYSVI